MTNVWQVIPTTVTGIEWPLTWKVSATCDRCHSLWRSDIWSFTYSKDELEAVLRDEGWQTPGDDVHICPMCSEAIK